MTTELVKAWIAEQEANLDRSGISEFELKITGKYVYANGTDPVTDSFVSGIGLTIPEAMQSLRAKLPAGSVRAIMLRDQAKELLRKANEIEGGAR